MEGVVRSYIAHSLSAEKAADEVHFVEDLAHVSRPGGAV